MTDYASNDWVIDGTNQQAYICTVAITGAASNQAPHADAAHWTAISGWHPGAYQDNITNHHIEQR